MSEASYVISCCSTADLSKEHFEERNINYIYFHYQLDGKEYYDDLGQTMSFPEFYAQMAQGKNTKTSQVNSTEYLEYFSKFLEQGKDIIHVCLSSGLSGTINSANNAALIAAERYPDRKIYIIDSLGASSGYGLIMDKLADLRDSGYSIDQLKDWVEENKLKMNHWFFSTDLTYYVKGGRISKAAGLFGGMLHICPLLDMDVEGHLVPVSKYRGKAVVIKEIVKRMEENADNGLEYAEKCYISHADCLEDAEAVAQLVEAKFPKLNGKVVINYVGTTIGAHTGPGTVALFFWGKKRS